MTGQFEWVDDRPKPRQTPAYAAMQAEHDLQPIWPHGGRVPGVRRPRRHTKETQR